MTFIKVVLLVAFLTTIASSGPLFRRKSIKIDRVYGSYRLPNNTAPISYNVKFIPYIVVDNFTFDGEVDIFLKVLEPTFNITLHTNALTYDETLTNLVSQTGVSQNVTSHTYVIHEQFLIIGIQNQLPVGNYTLHLSFVGVLADDMYGFYKSSYTNASGDTVWLALSHFEPTHARRAFPCYDEPALKATFTISIKHEPQLHALSNMPISQTYNDTTDGKVWTIFETTPVMSSYLVAFVVSEYSAVKNTDRSYNVWTRPNAIDEIRYAFDIGPIELAELEKFTNVTYDLPKMDQISLPDFSAGAMENWGLVTYKENVFHFNDSTSTHERKQTIATTISHEFAHQWFGNLVSPYWWKYLWLNEGFATYFQYLTTDVVVDNWRLMDQFVVKVQQAYAFVYDSSVASHPMNQDVSSPSEIKDIFDTISYYKASSVIRMMSHFLTEDVFKAGLTKFLNTKAYGAVVSDDLFEALQKADDEADILPNHVYVKEIMDTWVEQMGYPVLTITRNYATGTTKISQERFLLENADSTDDHDYKWWVPVNWATQGNPDFSSTVAADWIRSQDESIMISGFNVSGWVIFNKQQTGYYRVNYDDTNWGMLARYLNSDDYLKIHVLNRAALIDDAVNLAQTHQLSYSNLLELFAYLQREVDYIPWYPAFAGLTHLSELLANTDEWESFRKYASLLMAHVFKSVGIEETDQDDHVTRLNRDNVIKYACEYGLEDCRISAEEKIVAWLDNPTASPLSPTLRTNTICAGLRSANATTWNKALNKYLTSELSIERTALLAGLGCSENEAIINAWLASIINSTTGLTISHSTLAFEYVYENSVYNVDRAINFLVNNLDNVISYFGDFETVETFLFGLLYKTTAEAQLVKFNTFVGHHSTVLNTSDIDAAQKRITQNAVYRKEINTWLVAKLATLETTTTMQTFEITTSLTDDITTEGYETTTVNTGDSTTEDHQMITTKRPATNVYLKFFRFIQIFVDFIENNW